MSKIMIALGLSIWCSSCILSFNNVMTHGTATDVVDSAKNYLKGV